MDKVEQDSNKLQLGVLKFISLTVFQKSLSLFVTFDVTLRRHIGWTESCNFVIYK